MGERKGVNKYYPPDFNPEKHGSLNRYHNSHPLRERARKLSQGILVIRFEMPYNIWCDGCKNHIGMGVRYNAEKKKVGNYYTTPIYRFRMKCHLCVNYIEMQTDPANCDYVIVSGAQRKEERWDMADNEQVLTTEHEKKQKLETDAMFRLEHGEADRSALKKALPTLSHIQEAQSAWKDDFALNSMLRRRFREKKKAIQEEEERDQALQAKASLTIPLVPETEDDRRLAALLKFHTLDSYEDKQKLKRTEIISRSWFPSAPGSGPSSKVGSVLKKLAQSRRPVPAGSPISVGDLGIVRRRSRDVPESPQHGAETPKSGEAQVPQGTAQDWPTSPGDCPQEPAKTPKTSSQEGSCQDKPLSPPGSSQEAAEPPDRPQPCTAGSSLVADYSDSESD
uniref:Probable splicing factor YJU2B n=1 Tax=Microcebus murinus TaxID=30608 RepID=A0A8B7I4Q5_MICMU|nr:coiled-coil domain-containing protein 130 [Microcebus murinus]XP_012645848.1 coiled-coil domain-containing protein 130 [Microcebus murinus]XP_012645850.1 coiled-coil domain-containing protein 130 [Microcebus murinus]XP_012645851.1 coiled-coil domain-containing protein 130 [Microcebus murinus]XP_012645852.1 coiled-coil domain-containing protein 130 [Microcebus murinus]